MVYIVFQSLIELFLTVWKSIHPINTFAIIDFKMLSKICALSALAIASARTTWKDLETYNFEQFMAEFHLKYTSSELESRRSLFIRELARVRAHNAKNLSWKVKKVKHAFSVPSFFSSSFSSSHLFFFFFFFFFFASSPFLYINGFCNWIYSQPAGRN